MDKIWFTSDLHMGHQNIISYCNRPFEDLEHMHDIIEAYWNSTVASTDTVFVLGDVAMGKRAETLPVFEHFIGRKLLVPGNHDDCHPAWSEKKNYSDKVALYKRYFSILPHDYVIQVDDFSLHLSHFPYWEGSEERGRDQYEQWHPTPNPETDVLLCGHVHDSWKVKRHHSGYLMINVGMDVWNYTPVSLDQIIQEALSS